MIKWLFSWLKALQLTGFYVVPKFIILVNLTIDTNLMSRYFGFHSRKSFHPLLLGGRQETNHSNERESHLHQGF